jgi:hypothetical protein
MYNDKKWNQKNLEECDKRIMYKCDSNLSDRFQFQAPVPNGIKILGVGGFYCGQVDLPRKLVL